jgi:predicted MarR family transcription regulator
MTQREISTDVSVTIWINSIVQHMLRTRDDQKKLRDILEIIHTQKADMQQLMSYKSLMVIYSTLIIEDGQTL